MKLNTQTGHMQNGHLHIWFPCVHLDCRAMQPVTHTGYKNILHIKYSDLLFLRDLFYDDW